LPQRRPSQNDPLDQVQHVVNSDDDHQAPPAAVLDEMQDLQARLRVSLDDVQQQVAGISVLASKMDAENRAMMDKFVASMTTTREARVNAMLEAGQRARDKVFSGATLVLGPHVCRLVNPVTGKSYTTQIVPDTGASVTVAHPELKLRDADTGALVSLSSAFALHELPGGCRIQSANGDTGTVTVVEDLDFICGERRFDGAQLLLLDTMPRNILLAGTDLLEKFGIMVGFGQKTPLATYELLDGKRLDLPLELLSATTQGQALAALSPCLFMVQPFGNDEQLFYVAGNHLNELSCLPVDADSNPEPTASALAQEVP
jgi:hypothetical protein